MYQEIQLAEDHKCTCGGKCKKDHNCKCGGKCRSHDKEQSEK